MSKVIRNHGTVNDQVRLARKQISDKHFKRQSRTNPPSFRWDANAGFSGAVRLAENGWAEGAEKIKKVLDKVAEILRPDTFRQDIEHDVSGGYVDVGRYLDGNPECFVNYVPPEKPRKPLRVVVNASASGGVHAGHLMNRGAAIAAAIDTLERRGYMIELDVIDSAKGRGRFSRSQYTCVARAKDMGQPVDLDRLAFCLAHPAYLRRIVFGAEEHEPVELREKIGITTGGGYGTPCNDRDVECDLYFGRTYLGEGSNFATPESAAQWVKQILIDKGLVTAEDFGD